MDSRIVLLGSGELGKEVAIEAARLGCEVVAVDSYAGAPAMQVAQRSHVADMTDPRQLRAVLEAERNLPYKQLLVVPEIEAIATRELELLEAEGMRIVPTAKAARLTMDREGIRRLATEELGVPTSPYRFCTSEEELEAAAAELGLPLVVKPLMSSSGKGQSVVRSLEQLNAAWTYAQEGGRAGSGKVIAEGLVEFDFEITLLTVRHRDGTSFCEPIGHVQVDGDYRESWQPQPMSEAALAEAERIAKKVTGALGGYGIFGVELFVKGETVLFSEVSPRPHDTGMVTMATQRLSEFALHVRAVLGLPIPKERVPLEAPAGASCVVLADSHSDRPTYSGVAEALKKSSRLDLRIFGKPTARPGRRMGVTLAWAEDVETARNLARKAAAAVTVEI